MAQTLNINELSSFALKDIKSYFEFANGKVLVKPFHLQVKGIDMEIGGVHGLDQSIDYVIGMKIPRSMMGTQGNTLVNNLAKQASAKGIPVALGDFIDLTVKMGGSITSPTIKTDLKEAAGNVAEEMKQQVVEFAQNKIDSAKHTLQDSAKALKDQVVKDLKEDLAKKLFGGQKDTTNLMEKPLDNTKKNAEKVIKNTLNNLLKKKSSNDTTTSN